MSAAGGATGLLAGGLLTEWASWRWVMFVNVPIGLAVSVLGRIVLTETPRRNGRFDIAGAVTSTLGMSGIVLGLVEAGSSGWSAPITLASFIGGALMLAAFVQIEQRAAEPILPLRLFAHPGRTGANVSRGLLYAGMYGMFFFLTQFLQDVEGYSPLRTGVVFVAIPGTIFLASQLTTRVLMPRFPAKAVMLSGIGLAIISLLLSSRLHAGASLPQVLAGLVLLGAGSGISLVSLTSASLTGVEPQDAGAASGLINVVQQLGAALGLAILVTVFDAASGHVRLGGSVHGALSTHIDAVLVHGFDVVYIVSAVFGLLAVGVVALMIRPEPQPVRAASPAVDEMSQDAGSLVDNQVLDLSLVAENDAAPEPWAVAEPPA